MTAETARILIDHESKTRNQIPAAITFRRLPVKANSQRKIEESDTVMYVLEYSAGLRVDSDMGEVSTEEKEQCHQHETPITLRNETTTTAWIEAILVQWL